jgi:choline-sulfatase
VRPNLLIIMVDQLSGTLLPDGPASFLHAPALARLADRSVRFNANYCASPLCAPSRAGFMSGLLPSRTGVYDNAAEFASSVPTFAHHLRLLGYRTVLCGKMHFVGADQLHGFEERLTTDIYPVDFGWTPDWTKPNERIDWWYHNLSSVTEAGVAEMTNQLEYDDEVAHFANQQIFDLARHADGRPFCLTVSFTHPHDPYVMRRRFWDLYRAEDIPMPSAIPYEEQDPHSRRILDSCDWRRYGLEEHHIRAARHAYFAAVSYIDEKIGAILEALRNCRLADDTVVLFCADHGDMLGERGLWFKMNFFEGSARVPLMISWPGRFEPRSVREPTSLLDLLPTMVEIAGGSLDDGSVDGRSLVGLASGAAEPDRAIAAEYAAEASIAPMLMLRTGAYKYIHSDPDPPLLFDLAADADERVNLAGEGQYAAVAERFRRAIAERWDLRAFRAAVIESQARRRLVYEALRNGSYFPWDFQPLQKASERYMRNHMDLNELEASARFPHAASSGGSTS